MDYKDDLGIHLESWTSEGYGQDLKDFDWVEGLVLDVGCGIGHMAKILDIPTERYLGIEPSKTFREAAPDELRMMDGDIHNLPAELRGETVLCLDVLIHLKKQVEALKELKRVTTKRLILQVRTGDPDDPILRKRDHQTYRIHKGQEYLYNVWSPTMLHNILGFAGLKPSMVFNIHSEGIHPTLIRIDL